LGIGIKHPEIPQQVTTIVVAALLAGNLFLSRFEDSTQGPMLQIMEKSAPHLLAHRAVKRRIE
jgi:hypothetical protein